MLNGKPTADTFRYRLDSSNVSSLKGLLQCYPINAVVKADSLTHSPPRRVGQLLDAGAVEQEQRSLVPVAYRVVTFHHTADNASG